MIRLSEHANTDMLLLLYFVLLSETHGHLFVDSTGLQTLEAIQDQPVRLPNTTEVEDQSGILNVIQELRWLRAEVQALQQEIQALNSTQQTPGCDWQGVFCDCHLEDTQDHAAILIGSSCQNNTLQWTRVLDMHIATIIGNCIGSVNASICDGFFQ